MNITGEHTMCEALDRLINEGEERGIERGIERGTLDTLYRLVNSNTITVDDAAKEKDLSTTSNTKIFTMFIKLVITVSALVFHTLIHAFSLIIFL